MILPVKVCLQSFKRLQTLKPDCLGLCCNQLGAVYCPPKAPFNCRSSGGSEGLSCRLLFRWRWLSVAVILPHFLPHEDFVSWDEIQVWLLRGCSQSLDESSDHPTFSACLFLFQLVPLKEIPHVVLLSGSLQTWRVKFSSGKPLFLWRRVRPGLSWSWMLFCGERWGIKLGVQES